MLVAVVALSGLFSGAIRAAGPAPSQVYYVPFPEDNQLSGYLGINSVSVDPLAVFVSFSAASDNTVIYYDHWEDGYEEDITNPKQPTTQIFGDGNPANGYPPGNAGDLITAGTVFSLRNYVNTSTLQSVLDYDARDKIASFKPISVTKTSFPAATNTLLAGCVEVFERGLWGTEYRSPVGSNMPTSTATATLTTDADIFEYCALSIMAGEGGSTVQIDANNDGTYEQTVTLAEGGSTYVTGVSVGAHILADKPVQVVLFTGRPTSTYQSRDTSLLPTYRWSSSYYAPVSTLAANGTVVFLYNPGTSDITVNYDYRSSATAYTTASVTVPAGGNARVTLTESNGTTNFGAYKFYTTGTTPPVFYAFCAVDAASATVTNNQAYDGGFTLVGQPSLTTQVLVSLGIGRDPYSTTNPSENGNPVWITTAGNGHNPETVYVDYNGDNAGPLTDPNGNRYDVSYSLRELEQKKLIDPDGDQSGMLVYTLNPNVKLAAAWAQDPSVATAAQPGLDVSTLVPPLREGDASKGSTVAIDADGDGYRSAGDTLEYDIRTINTARTGINGPFTVRDNLPADVTYVAGSTKYRFSVNGAWQSWVAIPDDASGTAFPLDGSGFGVPGLLNVGQQIQVVFRSVIKPYGSLTPGISRITNTGSVVVTPYGVTVGLEWSDILYGSIGDRVWIDTNGDGVQDSGEIGLNNVVVYADLNNNGVKDTGEPSSTTSGDGSYLLPGLVAGTYTIRVDPSSVAAINPGYGPTFDADGLLTSYSATVTLATAQDITNADFGFRIGASVGDRVWIDFDGDGVQDAGEPGINGVRVFIDANGNGSFDPTERNSVTFGDGLYYIGNLAAGTYSVCIDTTTLPVGAGATFDLDGISTSNKSSITLLGAQHRGDLDFGYRGSQSIGDLVWEDVNGDGSNTATASTTYTVNDGRIDLNFDGVWDTNDDGFIGSMRIVNGYVDIDNDGSEATPDPDDDRTLANGGFLGYAVVNGGLDINGNGTISTNSTRDDGSVTYTYATTEPAIANVRVYIDFNNNGSFDANEPFVFTNASGNYTFSNLFNGTYQVRVDTSTLPVSMSQTFDLTSPVNDSLATVVLSGTSRTDVDFGYRNDASIGDRVWNDLNGNGVQDAGEPGIEGVIVYIDSNGNGRFDQGTERFSTTNVNGNYLFNNLAAGTYSILLEISTLPRSATQTFDYDGTATANGASRTVTAGQDVSDVDFGYRSATSVGDFVWLDANANGVQDSGEAGIAGVRVFLDLNGNDVFDSATEPSATTSATGAYAITGMVAGAYTARVDPSTLPAGMVPTYDLVGAVDGVASFMLSPTQTRTDLDFGYTGSISLGDRVWNDVNANGVQDSGESGIDGVTVTAFNASNNTIQGTMVTAGGGLYAFSNLLPGTYFVEFGTLSGYNRTIADQGADTADSDANSSTGRTANVTLISGQGNVTLDAGYYQPVTIGDYVWNDANANGQKDVGETGLSGVTVTLYRPGFGPDGIAGNADDANSVSTTTSDTNGAYSFSGLPPGTYQVGFGTLAGYSRTLADQGADASDSDANASTGLTATFAVAAGVTNNTIDAGYYQPVTIGDFVWNDANANGQQDVGESGLAGVVVSLYRPGFGADGIAGNADDAAAITSFTTATGGAYSFSGLRPGTYQLGFGTLAGYNRTFADLGADATDSDANAGTGLTTTFAVAAGAINNTIDAGYYQPVTIGDFVWNDANANGQQDVGESGLAGVTVSLYRPGFGPDGIAGNADDATAITSSTTITGGAYSFSGLPPGTYQVGFGTLSGYSRTLADQGADATDSDANASTGLTATFSLAAGQTNNTIDAAYYQPVTIGDFVWNDANANGQQDVGESGLAGVVVSLYRPGFGADGIAGTADDATAVTSSTTITGGAYSFSGLPPGTYQVGFGTLAGYSRTLADQGADATDSDANVSTGLTATFAVAAGVTNNTIDAGYYQPVAIGDFVWNDANANGQQDVGESGLAGVVVSLYRPGFGADGIAGNADDATAITSFTTLTGGAYNFTGLRPGTYQVGFGTLAGYNRTFADLGADATDSDANASTGLTSTFAVAAGTTNNTIDAGYYQPVTIGDFVWNDANANGLQDVGESGLAGVTVSLYRPGFGADGISGNADDATAITSTTTITGGAYSFSSLPPGTYQVGFGTLSGYNRTLADQGADATDSDANASTGLTSTFAVAAGVTNNTIDAGYYQPVTIGDFVWADTNANGQQNVGEPGLAGVTVTLYRPGFGPDGIPGNADDATAVTSFTTLTGGAYSFSGLRPGTYQVGFGTLSGYSRTTADQGSDSSDSDANTGTGLTTTFAIAAGATNNTLDAGYYQAGTISGLVLADTNNDNVGDVGIVGVTLTLYSDPNGDGNPADGVAIGSPVVTTTGGAYSFTNVVPGSYVVVQTQPSGYLTVSDGDTTIPGDDAVNSSLTDNAIPVTLVSGETDDGNSFIEEQPGTISGHLFLDTNGNGTQDSGEPNLANVDVLITDSTGGTQTVVTNSSGNWTATVQPGTTSANVQESDPQYPAGSTQTQGNDPTTVTVTAGGTIDGGTDGYFIPAIITGHLYLDNSGNGIQDGGEPDLANVDVLITDSNGNTRTVSTNSSGNWTASVPPGTTIANVQESDPQYPAGSTQTQGNDPTSFTAVAGTSTSGGIDGYFIPGTITGYVLADTNNDNTGDTPIVGVTLLLVDASGNPVDGNPNLAGVQPVTTLTLANGSYVFGGISPGIYGVVETQPSGYNSVSDKDGGSPDEIRPITVTNGVTNSGNTFVEEQPGSISGTVLADTDNDGDGDVPLSGVVLSLLDSTGAPVFSGGNPVTTTTLPDGSYRFTGVSPGNYRVVETQPSNYGSVSDTDGPNDNIIGNVTAITVSAGANNGGNHFIEIEFGVISGYVRKDTDNNGSGDAPLSGVILTLLNSSGSPVLDGLGAPIQAISNASGFYSFTQIPVGSYRVSQTQPSGYGSVSDVDGANNNVIGDETPIVITPGLTVTGRDFVEIQYGSIAGTVRSDIQNDGTPDLPISSVIISLKNSLGSVVATTVTLSDGSYSFANVLPGSHSIVQSQPVGYLSVSDIDGGNPDIIGNLSPVVVTPGGGITGQDFLERPQACPNHWADWQAKWNLSPYDKPGDNPDGDMFPNLIEYAFCMPPTKGIKSPFCMAASLTDPNKIDAVYTRTAGGALDVTYELQYIASLANSPAGWTTIALPPASLSFTYNTNGTETIRIKDLESITGLTGGTGFVRMRVSLDANGDSTYEAQATTEVGGWIKSALGTNCRTYNNPFISCPLFSGTVDSVNGNDLVLTTSGAGLDLSTVLAPGSSYFVEFTSGLHEGQRFDVTAGGVNSLTLANDASLSSALPPFNTLLGAPPSTLAGASFAIRKHWTLATMFPPSSFLATDSQTTADQVQVFADGAWTSYWLYDEDLLSTSNTPKWIKVGVSNLDDQGAVVIPPGQGTFINCRQVSGSLLAFGKVSENDFARPLTMNASLVGGGYPMSQSPASRSMTVANGFDGDRDYKLADMFYLWRGDTTTGATGYDTYYLLDGSPLQSAIKRWVKVGDAFITPRDNTNLFLPDRSVFLDLNQDLPAYRVAAPWTP